MANNKRRQPQQQRTAARAANSRRRRRRRTGKKTLHYIILVIFVLSAGAVLSLTTFFKIEEVRVVGPTRYDTQEIIATSGILAGENLFRVQLGHAEEALLENYPYIESVRLKRKLPPAIEIGIAEAQPAVAVMEDKLVVLITREGKVLERGKILIPPEVPVAQGVPTKGVREGELLGENATDAMVMVRYLLDAVESVGFENITNVDVSDPLNMLIVYENRILFKLGTESDLEHKLYFIQDALEDLGAGWEGRIDASNAKARKQLVTKPIALEEALALEKKDKQPERALPVLEDKDTEESVENENGAQNGESGNDSQD